MNAIWLAQAELRDVIEKTITLLVQFGVDTNAVTSEDGCRDHSTALMQCLDVINPTHMLRLESEPCILRILSRHVTFSPPRGIGLQYVGAFVNSPDLALGMYHFLSINSLAVSRD